LAKYNALVALRNLSCLARRSSVAVAGSSRVMHQASGGFFTAKKILSTFGSLSVLPEVLCRCNRRCVHGRARESTEMLAKKKSATTDNNLISQLLNPTSPMFDLQLGQTLKQKQKAQNKETKPPSSPQQKQQQTTAKSKSPSAPSPTGNDLISQLLNPSSPMYNKRLGIKLQIEQNEDQIERLRTKLQIELQIERLRTKLQIEDEKTKEGNAIEILNKEKNQNQIRKQKIREQLPAEQQPVETIKCKTLQPIFVTTEENEVYFLCKRFSWQKEEEIWRGTVKIRKIPSYSSIQRQIRTYYELHIHT